MSKINKIPSEIRNFFTEKRKDSAMEVKLFFCRMGMRDNRKVFLTSDPSLDFMRTYEIYATR